MSRPRRHRKRNPGLACEMAAWMFVTQEGIDLEDVARFLCANLLQDDLDAPSAPQIAAIARELLRRWGAHAGDRWDQGGRVKRERREVVRRVKASHPELRLSGPNRLGIDYLMWRLSERPDRPLSFAEIAAEIAKQLGSDLVRYRQAATEHEALEIDHRIFDLWRTAA